MRLMLIDNDAAARARTRALLADRWPRTQWVEYAPATSGPLPAEVLARGFDAVLIGPDNAAAGASQLRPLSMRAGFAPVVDLARVPDGELPAAVEAAARAQAQVRAARIRSGEEAGSRRFSGALIPAYRRVRTIAASKFAELHLAEADASAGLVVIKVARDAVHDPDLDPAFRRLLQEHDLAQRVDPRFAVRVEDLGISDEHVYMVMEYFDAGDLRQRMKSPMNIAAALRTAHGIARALEAVHGAGLLHRDLKPGNVMLRRDGSIALIDFGLARDAALASDLTEVGQILGTPHYMSPEQGHGEPMDGRSDVYSLGVILFEMLTGRKPFVAENPMAIIYLHRKEPVPELPGELGGLQPLLGRLLAKTPAARFASAAEAARAIEQELVDRELSA